MFHDYGYTHCRVGTYGDKMTNWYSFLKLMDGEGPFYTDFLSNVQEDFPNAGLASAPWGDGTDIPKLYALKDVLIEHFNLVYKYREIGSETESRWQWTIDKTFDNIKRRYELALEIYDDNEITKIGRFYKEIINREANLDETGENSGSSESSSSSTDNTKNTFNDTPIEELISTGNYASSITDIDNDATSNSESSTSTTKSLDRDITEEIIRTKYEDDMSMIESANRTIREYMDIIDEFVNEFKYCFISTLGRI